MSYVMPEPLLLPFYGGERTILKRDAMLIRISTDTGLKGFAPGPAHEPAKRAIEDKIRPVLIGKDPFGILKFPPVFDREIRRSYDAVEFALLDLIARCEKVPLSEVLGGRKRESIKVYGSAGMYMNPEAYAEEAAAIADMGFLSYKMRPALGPDEDVRTVELMRKAVGPDFQLKIDAHACPGDGSIFPLLAGGAAAAG